MRLKVISRREFFQAAVATCAIVGPSMSTRTFALQQLSQENLLQFEKTRDITLIHITDIHAQLKPIYFREPQINLGVGNFFQLPPHLTGNKFLKFFGIPKDSYNAYALTNENFENLARSYGKMGGLDRVATIINSIRADNPDALLLDGGDTWQGSYTSYHTQGQDMVNIMNILKPDAMTAHWEFTLGIERVNEIIGSLNFPMLGANIFDREWDEPAYKPYKIFNQRDKQVAVIGQAFPYLPIANPGWMFPNLSFGIREERLASIVTEVRQLGVDLVVLLSHNGFDVDRKLAGRVKGIDVILTGHTHDALPRPIVVGKTLLIASGSNGKFVTRLDLSVGNKEITDFSHRLIPVFSEVITPDKNVKEKIELERKPFKDKLNEVLGYTETGLYRRGNFNGTWDDLLCNALITERNAEISLSPGFRWGPSLLSDQPITREDLFNTTSMSYPSTYRNEMSGRNLHTILEDVADNLFNPDPYYQQGGDMVRVGGMKYKIDVAKPLGQRISDMTLTRTGELIDPEKMYIVSGWASVNQNVSGPAIWEIAERWIRRQKTVSFKPSDLPTK